ncbi:MAG: ATP-dependent 6-phosphofructokinase [Oscillospiraceae bacterium]|jgi:6-phosphofructokinase 1|nr:ATP-dependent 6-phosphofructokinase [Oscillospiraceae bacterium]
MHRIGVLTSGGDAPGMNAAVVSCARFAALYDMELVGIKRGYNGLLRKRKRIDEDMEILSLDTVLDIADQPGTYLRTARCIEFLNPDVREFAVKNLREMNIEGLIVIGGDGSFNGAMALCNLGMPCIGIPGTIDNDLAYTERSLGYDTAVNICVNSIRMIRATSRSHDRVAVVEVMGRNCGDIALRAAMCTGSEILVVPEQTSNIYQISDRIERLMRNGDTRATVIVAEGVFQNQCMEPFDAYEYLSARDPDWGKKHSPTQPMDAHTLAKALRYMVPGCEARSTVLGYIQRGSAPYAEDAAFAFESGALAVKLLKDGIQEQVIGVRNGKVFFLPIREALNLKPKFDKNLYDLINSL